MSDTEHYLEKMYLSVDRMNNYYLKGDLKSVESEKREQMSLKRSFFKIRDEK